MINAVVADMAAQVAALNTANHGVATLTFTTASIPAAVTAFEADAKAIMADVVVVASSLTGVAGRQCRHHHGRAANGAGSGRGGGLDQCRRGPAEDERAPGAENS